VIPRLRSIALPPEHGSWGFLMEALLLGLVAAPSAAGVWIAIAGTATFLARHPVKLVISDAMRRRLFPRTPWALGFVALYGGLAAAAALGTLALSRQPFWLPLLLAAPLGLAQLVGDALGRGRTLFAEMVGAALPGALASSIALAAGWTAGPAFALWVIQAVRALAAILHVRTRLRVDRGAVARTFLILPAAAYASGAGLVVLLARAGLAPWTAPAVLAVLLLRVVAEIALPAKPVRPQTLGLREMSIGLATVLLIGLGYRLRA